MRKLMAMLAGLGLFGGASLVAAAPNTTPPQGWVRYAELAGRSLPAWLDETTPAAVRLRDYLDGLRAQRGGEDVVLPLSVWVARDGAVTRVTAPIFAQSEPNADLQTVFIGRKLPPPPWGLRLPMRLRLRLASPVAGEVGPAPPPRDLAGRAP